MFSHYSKPLIALNFNFWRILKLEELKNHENEAIRSLEEAFPTFINSSINVSYNFSDEILTNTPPADLEKIAAQEEVDTKDIKGAAAFKEMQGDIKALVYVGKKADFSTFVHEAAHVARKTLNGDLLIQAESAFDVKDGKWTRAQEEEFAQGFEQYLKEGVAPTEELKNIFQKAAEFLSRIYKNLKEIIGINDDIRKVYDELLGKDNSTLKQAEERIDNEIESNSVFIKNILSSGRNMSEDERRVEIEKLLAAREYLYLHFPDGLKASFDLSFLKRVRAEIDFFIKDIEVGKSILERD